MQVQNRHQSPSPHFPPFCGAVFRQIPLGPAARAAFGRGSAVVPALRRGYVVELGAGVVVAPNTLGQKRSTRAHVKISNECIHVEMHEYRIIRVSMY